MPGPKIPAVTCAEETCRAQFVYLENREKGTIVPVDVSSLSQSELDVLQFTGRTDGVPYEKGRHVSHFKTCTNPGRFTRRKDRG